MSTAEQIATSEKELIQAMLKSDVQELDRLISDRLIFSAHTGEIYYKKDDLDAHRSGNIRIDQIEASDQIIQTNENVAVVFVKLKIKGSFFGNPSEGTFRFCRVWLKESEGWKITAAQSSMY
jgi:hypothetical protein